jgi:hypothetical protein
MPRIAPRHFHRLALAVTDVDIAGRWLERYLGAFVMAGPPQPGQPGQPEQPGQPGQPEQPEQPSDANQSAELGGADARFMWVGGYPVILLAGGAVSSFLQRHGPGVQSYAWEVDDNWTVEHIVRDHGIGVISVSMPGRFFFMHPKDTHGLLIEWCDGRMPRDPRAAEPGHGVVEVSGIAWTTAVVADADATAAWMAELMDVDLVEGNAKGPVELERTVDLAVGDITVRLVTPRSPLSRYAAALHSGPGVHSFTVRVPGLDSALEALAADGVPTAYRYGSLAATDPAATLGLRIDWTE